MSADLTAVAKGKIADYEAFVVLLQKPNQRLWYRYNPKSPWMEATTVAIEAEYYGMGIYLRRQDEPFPDHDGDDPFTLLVDFVGKTAEDLKKLFSLNRPAEMGVAA